MTLPRNPYVGPTAFTEGDQGRFFGRTAETRELTALVIARRAVLLYAQSGAGKTSLLQAGLIPELKRRGRMAVFPIARIMGGDDASPGGTGGNIYVANALARLFPGGTAAATLTEAFAAAMDGGEGDDDEIDDRSHLVIFDQFEETFTFHPEWVDQRQTFFAQLSVALADHPRLNLLLSMREDYLADLDAYAVALPDRMRTRMRLERLKRANALEAITGPAAAANMPFTPDAAEQLVDNLLRVRTGTAGDPAFAAGPYAEPVQLQIVCRQLWDNLAVDPRRGRSRIDAGDIARNANVDNALIDFYRQALIRARDRADVSERALRAWFGEKLITPAGTRGMVFGGATATEGLANAAVESLRDAYLIRAEPRGGGTWYELAHDRLVEPILADNHAWRARYRNPVADALAKGPDALLTGSALEGALAFARAAPGDLTDEERALLRRSEVAARNRRRFWIGVSGATAAVMVMLAAATGIALRLRAAAVTALDQAGVAANDVLDTIVDQLKDVPETDDVRRDLLGQADHVTRELASPGGSIEDAHRFWQAILEGDLQVEARALPAARELFERARSLAQGRASGPAGETYWRQNLSVAEDRLGRLDVLAGDDDHARAAAALFRQAIAIDERLSATNPNNAEVALQLWYADRDLGIVLDQLGDPAAETWYRRALAVATGLRRIDETSRAYAENLAETYRLLGQVYTEQQKLDLEYSAFDASRGLLEALSRPRPADLDLRAKVADARYGVAEAALDQAGDIRPVPARIAAARAASIQAIGIAEAVADLDPTNIARRAQLSKFYAQRSEIEEKSCRTDEALTFADKATQNARRLVDYDHKEGGGYSDTEYGWQRALMVGYRRLAIVHKERGEAGPARAAAASARAIARRLYDLYQDVNAASDLYVVDFQLADIESRAGDRRGALRDVGQALDLAATPRFQAYPQAGEDADRFRAARAALERGAPLPRLDECPAPGRRR